MRQSWPRGRSVPVRPFYSYSGGVARAGTKGGLWRPNGTPEPNQGHEGSVLKLDGPAALLKRCVASVCWPHASVSACGVLLAFQFAGSFSCRVELASVAQPGHDRPCANWSLGHFSQIWLLQIENDVLIKCRLHHIRRAYQVSWRFVC